MIFNGIEKDYLAVTRGRKRPAWAPINRELISVTGKSGAYLSHNTRQVRVIEVPVFLLADNFPELQKIKEDLAKWLVHNEPKELIFKDEPDRVYYAVVDGELDLDELVRWGTGSITFICPDPYKYGPEQTLTFPADIVVVENEGTAEANPIFEMTATKKTTFAMISNGEEYNLIGTPADDDVEIVDSKEKIYGLESMDGWGSGGVVNDSRFPTVVGTMQHDGSGMRPLNFGTGDKVHGPGVIRELNESVEDFEINAIFDIISERDIDNFRLEIDLFDENMNNIGMIGIKDNNRYKNERVGLGRVGNYRGGGVSNGYIIGEDNYSNEFGDNTLMHMTMKREGNEFSFMIGRWRVNKLNTVLKDNFHDNNNDFMGKLKYVQVLIGSFGDRAKPARLRINKIDLFKLSQATVDQTPYILYPGDVVTYDHKDDDILINGEPRNDLKNFGGSFFTLKKGDNMLLVTPEDSFDAKVTFSDKYL